MILRIPYVRCWWQAAQPATHARWIPYTAAQVAAHRAGRLVCKVLWLSLAFLPPDATVPPARLATGATPRQPMRYTASRLGARRALDTGNALVRAPGCLALCVRASCVTSARRARAIFARVAGVRGCCAGRRACMGRRVAHRMKEFQRPLRRKPLASY